MRHLEENVTQVSGRYRQLLAQYEVAVAEERPIIAECQLARTEQQTAENQFREAWTRTSNARQTYDDAQERRAAKQETIRALRDQIDEVLSELPDPTLPM